MQVGPPSGPAVPSPAEPKRYSLSFATAWIGSIPTFATQMDADRQRRQIQRDDHADDDRQQNEKRQALAIDAAGALRPAAVIHQAEREIDPSSRAFSREDIRSTMDRRYAQTQPAFRQALREARNLPASDQAKSDASNIVAQTELGSKPPKAPLDASGQSDPASATSLAGQRAQIASSVRIELPPQHSGSASASGQAPAASPPPDAAVANVVAAANDRPQIAAAAPKPIGAIAAAAAAEPSVGVSDAVHTPTTRTNVPTSVAVEPAGESAQSTTESQRLRPDNAGAEPADPSESVDRILRVLRRQFGRERSTTVMRIDPPHLGSLRLQMDLRKDAMVLRVDTQTEMAHRLLSDEVDRLRAGLEAAGIQLQRIEIIPPPALEAAQHKPSQDANGRRRDRERSRDTSGTDSQRITRAGDERTVTAPAAARVNVMA